GRKQTLTPDYVSINGLNWSPAGDELWYTAAVGDLNNSLYAVSLARLRVRPLALSPDGQWVLARQRFTTPPRLLLMPTGAGEARVLDTGAIIYQEGGAWFPDGKHLLLIGHEPDHESRCYSYDLTNGQARPVTPEGVIGHIVTPDGRFVVATDREHGRPPALYPFDGGAPRPQPGLEARDFIISFSADGRALYVAQGELPVRVFSVELATGRRELWRAIMPADTTGILTQIPPHITPDARAYAYTYFRVLSDLYLVDGLK